MPEPIPPLTDERLTEIRAVQLGDWLAEPWQSGLVSDDDGGHAEVRCGGTVIAMLPDWAYPIATWIAESHDDVPLLLAEVDRLRAALAEREALAAEYGARIVAASVAAAPRSTAPPEGPTCGVGNPRRVATCTDPDQHPGDHHDAFGHTWPRRDGDKPLFTRGRR